MSWPTLVDPGSTLAFPGPAYNSPGRHMIFPSRNSCHQAGIHQIWHSLAKTLRFWASTANSWPAWAGGAETRCRPGCLHPGGPASPLSRPAHPGFPAASRFPSWLGQLVPAPSSRRLGPGWAYCSRAVAHRAVPPARLGRARPTRPLLFARMRPTCAPWLGRARIGHTGRLDFAWTVLRRVWPLSTAFKITPQVRKMIRYVS
jgi:hypothetical protein